jgi:hypothetical protein
VRSLLASAWLVVLRLGIIRCIFGHVQFCAVQDSAFSNGAVDLYSCFQVPDSCHPANNALQCNMSDARVLIARARPKNTRQCACCACMLNSQRCGSTYRVLQGIAFNTYQPTSCNTCSRPAAAHATIPQTVKCV